MTLAASASCKPGESRCVNALTNAFCPRHDADYWRVSVASAASLIHVDVTYEKVSNMRLAVTIYAPDGVAVVGTEVEPEVTSAVHRVRATFAADVAGDYVVKVFDQVDQIDDPTTLYALHIGERTNPDALETNDSQDLASAPGAVALATGVHGYLASVGDVDWYELVPAAPSGEPTIVHAELRWPESQAQEPQLRLLQDGGWTFVAATTSAHIETIDTVRYRTLLIQRIAPSDTPIFAEVTSAASGYDDVDGYTLVLTTRPDSFEGMARDDRPENALVFNGTSGLPAQFEQTLAASDDVDWYRIDLPSSGGTHSLLHTLAVAPLPAAPAEPDFLLKMLFYLPTSTSCSTDAQCTSGPCNVGTGHCLTTWVQRPSRFGPEDCTELCDPQVGGLSPNYLETQLPVVGAGAGSLFVRVSHIAETFLAVPGYSLSDTFTYTLEFETKSEPDAADAAVTPDNEFVTEPLTPETDLSTSVTTPRPLVAGVDYVITAAASAGAGFVALADGEQVVAGTCESVAVYAFDAWGSPATGTTNVTLGGGLVASCGGATSTSITGATGTLYLDATALVADANHTVQITVDGNTVTQPLPIIATAAMPSLTFSRADGGTFLDFQPLAPGGVPQPRQLVVGTASAMYRVSVTPSSPGSATLQVAVASGSASLACGGNALDTVPTFGAAACLWNIGAGAVSEDFQVRADANGLVVLYVTAGGGIAPATLVLGAYSGTQAVASGWISGYLSYDGDQDFFSLPTPPGFTKGGATLSVRQSASPLDLRVALARGPSLRGVAYQGSGNDICDGGCASGTCDTRNQCTQTGLNASAGVANGECIYMFEPGDILLWVNDTNANDWDEGVPYEVQFEITEGCPATCSSYMCSQ